MELALALPVLLIMLSGLLEFGFALNQYLNALDAAYSLLSTGAETPEALLFQVMLAGVDFELLEPVELHGPLRAIAARFQRALAVSP